MGVSGCQQYCFSTARVSGAVCTSRRLMACAAGGAQVRGLEVSREILEQGLHSSVEGDVKEMLQGWALYTLDSEGLTHSA